MSPASASADVVLAEQYAALRKQIPLMYALMFIDIIFLAASSYGDVPLTMSLGMPVALTAAIAIRAGLWLHRRSVEAPPLNVRKYLRGTIVAAAMLSVAFGGWGLLLFEQAQPQRSMSVALYVFVGAISCCYCLLALPTAGRLVLLFGAMPVTIRLLLSGDWQLMGIGANFVIVALLILRTMSTSYADFTEVVRGRSDMEVERERARAAEQRAQEFAYRDALTGLQNRRALSEHLDAFRFRDRSATHLALLVLDLDRFKAVNDVHGHPAGDSLLQAVAARLTGIVDGIGTAYRLGGDEFAVTVEIAEPNGDAALKLAQLIVTGLAAPFPVDSLIHHIGASVGVSVLHRDAVDREAMMRQADIALYKAKESGRSQHRTFEAQMDVEVTRRSVLERALRDDINGSALRPFYQPIVNLASGRMAGFEMLARWHRWDGEEIGPNQFIPIAEECGLVGELMLKLLDQACIDAAAWGPDVTLAVNVSPVQLKDPWFSEKVLAVLTRTGFPARRITLEITENALIAEPANAKRLIQSLKNQGMLLALDDFGTGFSSIQHLKMLPFDKIKIDRSFVQGLERDSESYKMVLAITRLAASLDVAVIAEGIEDMTALEIVRELGCAEGQGYLFGRPMDARAAVEALRSQTSTTFMKSISSPTIRLAQVSQ
jgi:diguanylate cyclase (GGDEF)-like protein